MLELLHESLRLVNLPFTFLMVVVVVYWILMIVGVVAVDSLDGAGGGGLDLDADGDVDLELGGETDPGAGPAHGLAAGVLSFVNADRVPLAIVLSFFFLFMWVGMIVGNYLFNPPRSMLIGIVVLVPVYIGAVLLTKICTMPFVKFFGHLKGGGDEDIVLLGKTGRLLNKLEGERIGQMEVETGGAPLRLNVRSFDGVTQARGSQVVIVHHVPERDYYVVKPAFFPDDDDDVEDDE